MFKPVDTKISFPRLEEEILRFWKERLIFQKSLQQREGASRFTLYEGPPTVNGNPGVHHVLARVFKDVIPRYKTMKGYYAPRKAGWDTHGLPVELEVEGALGFTAKPQIESYGVDQFNARCRESVLRYLPIWERLTERIGYWVDTEHPYITFDNGYIESLWWIIRQLWDKGLIYQGHRVTPHCPRCGTSLSSHEVALGYQDNTPDPSVYVKFRLAPAGAEPSAAPKIPASEMPTFLLAWTTTPWTLPGNVALAVDGSARYALIEVPASGDGEGQERLILAEALLSSAITGSYQVIATLPGSDLVGMTYKPLFDPYEAGVEVKQFQGTSQGGKYLAPCPHSPRASGGKLTFPVIGGDFVTLEEGTGIVHIAPAFGEVDYHAGGDNGLYFVQPVDLQGKMTGSYPFAGYFVKQADPLILEDLRARGLLYRTDTIAHTYPFCWRCNTPLLYYAKPSWYIKTTAAKSRLIAGNDQIRWYPEHIKEGRFGDWLENNVDWAFSRERYWGTPLNIWQCERSPEHRECLGSLAELRQKAGLEGLEEPLDLHRPFVDRITYPCPHCGGRMHRLPEVLDAWFDSGAMPVAQWHYPFENQEQFQKSFPADYICEAVDQTRGWFYTLHAVSTLLFDAPCFQNVICLGHILDAEGEKMSKTRGNVVDPWSILEKHGADALRWYMLTAVPPGNVRRFSTEQLVEEMRRFILTLWNTYSFFVMYANIDDFDPASVKDIAVDSDLDRWIISDLHLLISAVTDSLDHYDPTEAGRKIKEFVDALSNWYVRRSRRRFWKSESDADKLSAYSTLYQCLVTLSQLLAPFTPFIAEEMYQNLVRSAYPEAPESVHLCDFPLADPAKVDDRLSAAIHLARKVCSLGRAARSKAGIKVRQPLARVVVNTRLGTERENLLRLAPQVLEELNVKAIQFVQNEAELVAEPGYSTAADGGYAVGMDTRLSPELVEEGMAREIVHRLQTMRRSAGFDIADYVVLYYQGEAPLPQVMQRFSSYIQQETLARQIVEGIPESGAYTEKHRIDGHLLVLGVKRL